MSGVINDFLHPSNKFSPVKQTPEGLQLISEHITQRFPHLPCKDPRPPNRKSWEKRRRLVRDEKRPTTSHSFISPYHPRNTILLPLGILNRILLGNTLQQPPLTTLMHLTSNQQLIKDIICLLKIKYNVQLAHISIVLVHLFDVAVYDLQRDEFVVGAVDSRDEEEGSIAAVYYFCV